MEKTTLTVNLFKLYDEIYFACSEEYKKTRNKITMGDWIRRACKAELKKINDSK